MDSNINDDPELAHIMSSMVSSAIAHDSQMFDISLQDLFDHSKNYKTLRLILRFVMFNSDRVEVMIKVPDSGKIITVNNTEDPVLTAKYTLLLRSMKPEKYVKHFNDMSPEEYAWCKGVDTNSNNI